MWKRKLWEQCAAFLCHSGSHPPLPCSAFKQEKTGKLVGWGPEVRVPFAVSWGSGEGTLSALLITLGMHIFKLLLHHLMSVNSSRWIFHGSGISKQCCPLMVQTAITLSRLQSCLAVQWNLRIWSLKTNFFFSCDNFIWMSLVLPWQYQLIYIYFKYNFKIWFPC